MSFQVGRKSKSKNLGLMQLVELPLWQITHQPRFARGAKREIRDKNGKLLYNARNSRWAASHYSYFDENRKPQSIPLYCQKKDVEITLKNLLRNGCKKPKASPMTQLLPRICPSCDKEGTIVWNEDYRDNKKEWPKIRFWFNHSKTKPKRCFLGTWDYNKSQIRRKEGIDFRKMSVGYYLKPGEERYYDLN